MIYTGDCLEIMPTLPDKSIDMILCDLPYGTTACKWDAVIPFEPLWKEYKRLIKDGGAIVLTASQPFTAALVMSNPEWFRYEWVWSKRRITGFLNANHRPMSAHESILIFSDSEPRYYPQMRLGFVHKRNREERHTQNTDVYSGFRSTGIVWSDEFYPTSVIEFGADPDTTVTLAQRPGKIKRHPTQKPAALFGYLIRTYTDEGDTVLDNCAGSGTTGMACIYTNRKYILIEKDKGYCEIIKHRIEAARLPLFTEATHETRRGA